MKLFHKKSFLELVTPSLTVNLTEFFGRPHTPTLGHFPKYYLFFSFFFFGGGAFLILQPLLVISKFAVVQIFCDIFVTTHN